VEISYREDRAEGGLLDMIENLVSDGEEFLTSKPKENILPAQCKHHERIERFGECWGGKIFSPMLARNASLV